MKNKRYFQAVSLILLILSLFVSGCTPQAAAPIATPQPLTGKVTRANVQAAAGWEALSGRIKRPCGANSVG